MSDTAPVDGVSLARLPPLRLFLVEDSAMVRELMMESFATIPGITFAGFSDSEDDAFAQLQHAPCDIVIVDIQLRQGNGISLLRRLAIQPGVAAPIHIILSNNVSAAYRSILDQINSCFFFDKTTEFSQLHTLLQQLGTGVEVPKK